MNTIAAVSTPFGKGGVALIRISGPEAFSVADRIALRQNGNAFSDSAPGRALRATFVEAMTQTPFDDGLVTLFRAPHSFTGEDVAELCCHGGILVTKKLLQEAFIAGASPALPGEFTRRAFQNGKISLTQAEAIGGLIDAESEKGLTVSLLQCHGSLSEKLASLCGELKYLLASVYAFIDYPDEDMTDVSVEEMKEKIRALVSSVQTLCDSHAYGKAISEGIRVAIIGKPNTGKSALLNALAGEECAIVTDIAGTTRDVVREKIRLGDLLLLLSDTAGIRESDDPVERMGIQKSKNELAKAELVLAVFDASRAPEEEDKAVLQSIRDAHREERCVFLLNKTDIASPSEAWEEFLPNALHISAKTGAHLDLLESAVRSKCGLYEPECIGEIVLGARQNAALCKAKEHLIQALNALDGYTQDLAGMDLEQALAALEEVDGKTASDEIVSEIFSHFCVGK